jgi:alpha-glucosidase
VSDYEHEPAFTRFLADIPTIWTDTRVIDGRIADYVVVARQATDGTWWAGAMTDWTPRELSLPLAFLPDGAFTAEIWQDGPNAARYAADWQHVTRPVAAGDTLAIRMAPGGGWVARITVRLKANTTRDRLLRSPAAIARVVGNVLDARDLAGRTHGT